MEDATASVPAALVTGLLGLDGFAVLATAEVDGELELLVETTAGLVGLPGLRGGGPVEGPPPDVGA